MKLCFVCHEYPPVVHGGIGSMTQTLARALSASGHRVRVVGSYSGQSDATCEHDAGVEVWRLPVVSGPFGWVATRRRLYRVIAEWSRRGEIDLVEVPDWQGAAAHWPQLPVPVISRLNGSATYFAVEMGRRPSWLTRHLEARSFRRADAVASVSQYTASRTGQVFSARTVDAVLPNPVALGLSGEWEKRRTGMVVFSGTLTEKKGIIQLLDAWLQVAPRFPQATLHVLGKDGAAPGGGSMTTFLRSRLGDALQARVVFHGHQPREQVLSMLREARVAVYPSFAEAFAIAPLEAMAAGCPTIGTSLGSGPELLRDGVDGLTCDPRDPSTIAQALSQMLGDDALARRLGEAGRATVSRKFSIEHLLPANEQFFAACIAHHTQVPAASWSRSDSGGPSRSEVASRQ